MAAVVRLGAQDADMERAIMAIMVDVLGDDAKTAPFKPLLNYVVNRPKMVKDQAKLFKCSLKQAKQLWNKPVFAKAEQKKLR